MLSELADEDDIDGLLSVVSPTDIAQAWVRYGHREHDPDEEFDADPDSWALTVWWSERWWNDPELPRVGLLALVDAAETDYDLGMIGAGPLENFVSDNEDDLQWLEQECHNNPGLRRALAGVWCSNHVSKSTLERLDAAAGAPLARLNP